MKLEKLQKIYDIVVNYMAKGFSGTIEIKICLKDGGIMNIEKNIRDTVK